MQLIFPDGRGFLSTSLPMMTSWIEKAFCIIGLLWREPTAYHSCDVTVMSSASINVQGLTYFHYTDVTMSPMASQITSLGIVYSTVYSDADQRKHQSSASLTFVRRIHRGPVNSPHKRPVTRKRFPFDDVIMYCSLVLTTHFTQKDTQAIKTNGIFSWSHHTKPLYSSLRCTENCGLSYHQLS